MRIKAAIGVLVVVACLLRTPIAMAGGPCDDTRPGTGTPVRVPVFGPADFGTPQEICARTAISVEGRAALLIAERDFYGTLLAGLAVRATVALPRGTWVSAWVPGLESRYVANATVDTDSTSVGAGALGFHVPVAHTERLAFVTYGRLLAPTETVFTNARRYGVEHGTGALVRVSPKLDIVGAIAFASTFTVLPGRVTTVTSPSISGDVVFRPSRGVGLVLGMGLRPLESFDPRAQVRLYPWRNLQISLGGLFPILGRDRTTAALSLSVGWDGI
jgi:hypothetical protein